MTPEERNALLNLSDEDLWEECECDFRKGTGNGGQKLNKTSSAVRIFHAATGITVNCLESRSQSVNRKIALHKLRLRIAARIRCKDTAFPGFRIEPVPSVEGRLYPAWIAGLFDHLARAGWDVKATAQELGTSRSRITKLLQRDPSLWREYLYASGTHPEEETDHII